MQILTLSAALALSQSAAWAIPAPAKPLTALQPEWREIRLRVDMRNVIADENSDGRIPPAELAEKINEVNRVWSQCAIRFVARDAENVSAKKLGAPFPPKSEKDLGTIAGKLNPNGFDGAIPVAIAGPWTFYDPSAGVYLHGLGWEFTRGGKIDRIGAMVAAQNVNTDVVGEIIGHELGHALSLPHVADPNNLMLGGPLLTKDQCEQARHFAETVLQGFQI